MAEGVKSRFAGSASDSQPVEDCIKHIFPDYVRMKGRPLLAAKDEVLRGFVGCLLEMCGENFREHVSETDRPHTPNSFGSDQLPVP